MTPIKKAVKRRTDCNFANYGPDRRAIVVSIEPGDVLGFRLLRTRKTYIIGITDAMRYAVRLEVARERAEKAAARKLKRAA
jgi:hypothetical protein